MNKPIDYKPLQLYLNSLAPLEEQEWHSLNEILYIRHYDKKELCGIGPRTSNAIVSLGLLSFVQPPRQK